MFDNKIIENIIKNSNLNVLNKAKNEKAIIAAGGLIKVLKTVQEHNVNINDFICNYPDAQVRELDLFHLIEGEIVIDDLQNKLANFAGFISEAHMKKSLSPRNAVRGHDGRTPYYCHPIACAFMVMEDNNSDELSFINRVVLAVALLGHDVIEDTSVTLEQIQAKLEQLFKNRYITDRVTSLIGHCTIEEGMSSMDEFQFMKDNIDTFNEDFWYCKMVDKWFNLFGSKEYFIKKGTLNKYIEFLEFLVHQVENGKYKESMFVSQAKALCDQLKVHV